MLKVFFWINLLLILKIALYKDLRYMKIPNWLTFYGMISGIVLNINPSTSFITLLDSILGLVSAFIIFYLLYLLAGIGAGDAKLMMAIGAYLGPIFISRVTLVIAILTIIVSTIILIRKKIFLKTLKDNMQYLIYIVLKILSFGNIEKEKPVVEAKTKIPYAAIIVPAVVFTLFMKKLLLL